MPQKLPTTIPPSISTVNDRPPKTCAMVKAITTAANPNTKAEACMPTPFALLIMAKAAPKPAPDTPSISGEAIGFLKEFDKKRRNGQCSADQNCQNYPGETYLFNNQCQGIFPVLLNLEYIGSKMSITVFMDTSYLPIRKDRKNSTTSKINSMKTFNGNQFSLLKLMFLNLFNLFIFTNPPTFRYVYSNIQHDKVLAEYIMDTLSRVN